MGFAERARMTLDEARRVAGGGSTITHVLDNGDGTYSVMHHIVCEFCDYCETQGDCRGEPEAVPVPAEANPYENAEKMEGGDGGD